jgi:hypothetical protein
MMAIFKNKSTPARKAFWDHVESIAEQSRSHREVPMTEQAVPEMPKRDIATLAREITEMVARETASILHVRNDLGTDDAFFVSIDEAEFCADAVALANGEECGCMEPEEVMRECPMARVESQLKEWAEAEIATLRSQVEKLEQWKREQLVVESEWDAQAVGKELDLPWGASIHAGILPAVKALKARISDLCKQVEKLSAPVSQWISVKDEMPHYGRAVLVVYHGVVQHVTYRRDIGEWIAANDDTSDHMPESFVTHWMPLPEPPVLIRARAESGDAK